MPASNKLPVDRPYREGWTILPEMEGSLRDELYSDCEAIREGLDGISDHVEAAGQGRVGDPPGEFGALYEALYAAVERRMEGLRGDLRANGS